MRYEKGHGARLKYWRLEMNHMTTEDLLSMALGSRIWNNLGIKSKFKYPFLDPGWYFHENLNVAMCKCMTVLYFGLWTMVSRSVPHWCTHRQTSNTDHRLHILFQTQILKWLGWSFFTVVLSKHKNECWIIYSWYMNCLNVLYTLYFTIT